ncbi:MAG TPA: hypothetical protein PLU50_03300, partial [Pseudobdellovibrionaceae bacterium]|nr:hypothetical protein [Pseudobdellovibrionaceae bacterium]
MHIHGCGRHVNGVFEVDSFAAKQGHSKTNAMKDKGKMNEHRKNNLVVSPESDQKNSKHTAIISDLHLCEAQVPIP